MARLSGSSTNPEDSNAVFLIVGGIFTVIGAVALAICSFLIVAGWQGVAAATATTQGTITVVRPVDSYDHHDDTCTLRYTYEVDGRRYDSGTRTSDTWACSRYEGEAVEVHYDPAQPWKGAIMVDQAGLWALTLGGTLGPLAFLGAGVFSLVSWIRQRRRAKQESAHIEPTNPTSIEPTGSLSEPAGEPGADGWPLLESHRPDQG